MYCWPSVTESIENCQKRGETVNSKSVAKHKLAPILEQFDPVVILELVAEHCNDLSETIRTENRNAAAARYWHNLSVAIHNTIRDYQGG